MTKAVTVVLADHHAVVADGLRVLLDAEDDLAVVDVAHDDGKQSPRPPDIDRPC